MTELGTSKLSGLPPTSKLVLKVLEHEGPLTSPEVSDCSWLSRRTTRSALQRLESAGIVEKRKCLEDARKNWYDLKSTAEVQSSD